VQQGSTVYARMFVTPSLGATFQSVTLTQLELIQQTGTGPVNVGSILSSNMIVLLSSLTSNAPTSALWDFDFLLDPAVVQATNTYYVSCTVVFAFANTGGTLSRRLLLTGPQSLRAQAAPSSAASRDHGAAARAGSSQGLYSQTFYALPVPEQAVAATTISATSEGPPSAAPSVTTGVGVSPVLIGAVIGAVALVAVVAVVVVVLFRRRRPANDSSAVSVSPRYNDDSSDADVAGGRRSSDASFFGDRRPSHVQLMARRESADNSPRDFSVFDGRRVSGSPADFSPVPSPSPGGDGRRPSFFSNPSPSPLDMSPRRASFISDLSSGPDSRRGSNLSVASNASPVLPYRRPSTPDPHLAPAPAASQHLAAYYGSMNLYPVGGRTVDNDAVGME
jgi:hypothetical protein